MEHIWAPWRIQYILGEKPEGCVLCNKPAENTDVQNYIVFRGKTNYIILNSYPYNPGHLLIAPYSHTGNPEDLTEDERNEHFQLISRSLGVLKKVFKPGGFNIGANIGRVAGAGIEDHFHSHIVPRWKGDTNFMPVISDTNVVNEALSDTYKKLKQEF